jgi:acyl-CoA synthetase (AMP-forming)/AMP-acid ligase II
MPITEILEKNCRLYGNDVCLVEINPEQEKKRHVTWKEYELIEPSHAPYYRREITWNIFNEKANRLANYLLGIGIGKGKKVAILMMNGLEWLPIYFGVLKTGALAVPLNFRYPPRRSSTVLVWRRRMFSYSGRSSSGASRRSPMRSPKIACLCTREAGSARRSRRNIRS